MFGPQIQCQVGDEYPHDFDLWGRCNYECLNGVWKSTVRACWCEPSCPTGLGLAWSISQQECACVDPEKKWDGTECKEVKPEPDLNFDDSGTCRQVDLWGEESDMSQAWCDDKFAIATTFYPTRCKCVPDRCAHKLTLDHLTGGYMSACPSGTTLDIGAGCICVPNLNSKWRKVEPIRQGLEHRNDGDDLDDGPCAACEAMTHSHRPSNACYIDENAKATESGEIEVLNMVCWEVGSSTCECDVSCRNKFTLKTWTAQTQFSEQECSG
jgi:hypothetical protein